MEEEEKRRGIGRKDEETRSSSNGENGKRVVEIILEAEGGSCVMKRSVLLHIIKELIGFVLYMHHQIPSVLQHIEEEFDSMTAEYQLLEGSTSRNMRPEVSSSRKCRWRMREVKQGIRKLDKLMKMVTNVHSALEMVLNESTVASEIILILGANPSRPQHVYEIGFSNVRLVSGHENSGCSNVSRSQSMDAISKRVIRSLISKGAVGSYIGPMKLFLLAKAPSSSDLQLHFFPKREFKYGKKVAPFRLEIKGIENVNLPSQYTQDPSDELIWFQCRHSIKGLACRDPSSD